MQMRKSKLFLKLRVTLETLNLKPFKFDKRSDLQFKGGEDVAMDRMNRFINQSLATYKQTRNGLQGANYSSHFSPWLANGCMSAKQVYYAVSQFEKNNGGQTTDTYWLVFELLFRDYFRFVLNTHGDSLFREYGPFNRNNTKWKNNESHFIAWIEVTYIEVLLGTQKFRILTRIQNINIKSYISNLS